MGYEAISNIIEERILNGKFESIHDFITRVNPKDINKLQLEGLVKAGAFDNLNSNRQALYDSIPGMIAKNKNIFDNKSANQIDLFSEDETAQDDILIKTEDWKFEVRLSQEFEAVEHEACTIEDNDDVDLEDQEQLPDLEALYESDWLPASIPDAGDIQHQSAHDDMYQIPESWEWVRAPPCKRSRGQIPFSEMEHVD